MKSSSGQEALSDLARQTDDADSQAGLRKEIRKAAEQDPEFAKLLQELVTSASATSNNQFARWQYEPQNLDSVPRTDSAWPRITQFTGRYM